MFLLSSSPILGEVSAKLTEGAAPIDIISPLSLAGARQLPRERWSKEDPVLRPNAGAVCGMARFLLPSKPLPLSDIDNVALEGVAVGHAGVVEVEFRPAGEPQALHHRP